MLQGNYFFIEITVLWTILSITHKHTHTHAHTYTPVHVYTHTHNTLGDGYMRGFPRSVMVKVMNCGIVVSDFVHQSRYYVNFRTNTLGKGMNPLILPAMG